MTGSDVTGSDVISPALFSYYSSTFWYGKYGWKVSWIVKIYGKYGSEKNNNQIVLFKTVTHTISDYFRLT
jgi:hypothetical protein